MFEFQYKCVTEIWFLSFYKRPGQNHNFDLLLEMDRATSFYIFL